MVSCNRVYLHMHGYGRDSPPQENVAAVNEALNELYIEDEDHEKLRESVDDYDNFDQVRRYLVALTQGLLNLLFTLPLSVSSSRLLLVPMV